MLAAGRIWPEHSSGQVSVSRNVPARVPSVRHSSVPVSPSEAVKRATLPRVTKSAGKEPAGSGAGLTSLTRCGVTAARGAVPRMARAARNQERMGMRGLQG